MAFGGFRLDEGVGRLIASEWKPLDAGDSVLVGHRVPDDRAGEHLDRTARTYDILSRDDVILRPGETLSIVRARLDKRCRSCGTDVVHLDNHHGRIRRFVDGKDRLFTVDEVGGGAVDLSYPICSCPQQFGQRDCTRFVGGEHCGVDMVRIPGVL